MLMEMCPKIHDKQSKNTVLRRQTEDWWWAVPNSSAVTAGMKDKVQCLEVIKYLPLGGGEVMQMALCVCLSHRVVFIFRYSFIKATSLFIKRFALLGVHFYIYQCCHFHIPGRGG